MKKEKTIELINLMLIDYMEIYLKYKNEIMLEKIKGALNIRRALERGLISYIEALENMTEVIK